MEAIYKITEGEYVHFSTTKPPRGTSYEVVVRENKPKEQDEQNN